MNWDRAKGNWKQFKGGLRRQLARFTDNPMAEVAGQQEILAGQLQEAYGIGKEQADRRPGDWQASVRDVANDIDAAQRQVNARR
jgi:uncharacterized protein YjbJ (UPF0337 family)